MIRVLLADDHPVVRTGLRQMIGAEQGMVVVGDVASGDEVLAAVLATPVDVVVLDISMPGPPFLELLKRLGEAVPATRVLVMSMHAEEQYAIRALRGGAAGYLTKDRSTEQLGVAIRHVYAGRRYVTPSLAEHLAAALTEGASAPHDALSPREFDVFQMLVAGKTVKQVAASLSLSMKTVSTYRTRIMQKLGAQTTADLVRYALKHQLLDLNSG